MLFYLEEHENILAFQGREKDMCSPAQRKSLLRKLKLILISHGTHRQTHHQRYIQITQTHKTCATNTIHTNRYCPHHLNLTQTKHILTTHTHQHTFSRITPVMSPQRQRNRIIILLMDISVIGISLKRTTTKITI